MRRFLYLTPILALSIVIGFFASRLAQISAGQTPELIPSVLIGKPAPTFDLPSLFKNEKGLKTTDLQGKVTLINFFASWCIPCQSEHDYLSKVKEIKGLRLVGINYKNAPQEAEAWLQKLGNPYDAIGSDREGRVAIDFGVYGVPESYLIDPQGIIRFKQTGPLTPTVINNQIMPLVKEFSP